MLQVIGVVFFLEIKCSLPRFIILSNDHIINNYRLLPLHRINVRNKTEELMANEIAALSAAWKDCIVIYRYLTLTWLFTNTSHWRGYFPTPHIDAVISQHLTLKWLFTDTSHWRGYLPIPHIDVVIYQHLKLTWLFTDTSNWRGYFPTPHIDAVISQHLTLKWLFTDTSHWRGYFPTPHIDAVISQHLTLKWLFTDTSHWRGYLPDICKAVVLREVEHAGAVKQQLNRIMQRQKDQSKSRQTKNKQIIIILTSIFFHD